MAEYPPELVERAARAIFESAAGNKWDGVEGREHWIRRAQAVLDALGLEEHRAEKFFPPKGMKPQSMLGARMDPANFKVVRRWATPWEPVE